MTTQDIATYRKYINFTESEYIDEIEKLMLQHLDEEEKRQKLYAVKVIRWVKAWRNCDFSQETVERLIATNRLLEDKIEEMLKDARNMVDWRKAQLDKRYGFQRDRTYYEDIWTSVQIEELDSETKDFLLYRSVLHHGGKTVCDYHLSISNSLETGFSRSFVSINYRKSKHFTFPCKAVSVYLDFMEQLKVHNHLQIPIDSGLATLMRVPNNIGNKWKNFFAKLDKFHGEIFCTSMLDMIGSFLLTPQDVCAISGYSYHINFEHHSEEYIIKMD